MWAKLLLIVCLIVVFYQDCKYRLIHISLPVLIIALGLYISHINKLLVIYDVLRSGLFLVIVFLVMTIYFSIKYKQIINPLINLIGLGDLFFLIAIIPLFNFERFLFFFTFSMGISLLIHFIFNSFYKENKELIPLAGYLSIQMSFVLIFRWLF